jgi:purine-binding chemotaxis protein CheW
LEILTFDLSGQRFGVSLDAVREVVRAVAITPVPGMPSVVEGIIDVRGEVVPVFDLRARFGLPARALHPAQHFVIARAGERTVALRVDRAEWMQKLDDASFTAADRNVPAAKHIVGIARLEDGLVLIHDLDAFLTAAESDTLDAALEAWQSEAEPA